MPYVVGKTYLSSSRIKKKKKKDRDFKLYTMGYL